MNDGPGFNPFAASPSKKDEISYDWANHLMSEYVPGMVESSAKFQVLFAILDETIRAGERMLLFSQSLLTLNLVEEFLRNEMTLGGESKFASIFHFEFGQEESGILHFQMGKLRGLTDPTTFDSMGPPKQWNEKD